MKHSQLNMNIFNVSSTKSSDNWPQATLTIKLCMLSHNVTTRYHNTTEQKCRTRSKDHKPVICSSKIYIFECTWNLYKWVLFVELHLYNFRGWNFKKYFHFFPKVEFLGNSVHFCDWVPSTELNLCKFRGWN